MKINTLLTFSINSAGQMHLNKIKKLIEKCAQSLCSSAVLMCFIIIYLARVADFKDLMKVNILKASTPKIHNFINRFHFSRFALKANVLPN